MFVRVGDDDDDDDALVSVVTFLYHYATENTKAAKIMRQISEAIIRRMFIHINKRERENDHKF